MSRRKKDSEGELTSLDLLINNMLEDDSLGLGPLRIGQVEMNLIVPDNWTGLFSSPGL